MRLYKQDEAEDTSHYFDLVTLYCNSLTMRRVIRGYFISFLKLKGELFSLVRENF